MDRSDLRLKKRVKNIIACGTDVKKLDFPKLPTGVKLIQPPLRVQYSDRATFVKRKNKGKIDLGAFQF